MNGSRVPLVLVLAGGVLVCGRPGAAEVLSVAGHGEAVVQPAPKKKAAEANRAALAAAEEEAVRDAVAQAVSQVYGDEGRLGGDAARVHRQVADHSAAMVVDRQVSRAEVRGDRAIVELVLKVDGGLLREYLEGSLGLSLAREAEGRFRVFVLSYTVEGEDPDRSAPPVLREEIVDDRTDVHSSSSASERTESGTRKESASVKGSSTAVAAGGGAALGASGAVDARARSDSSSYERSRGAESSYSDTSTKYRKLVVYADTTKKGAGSSNEIRAKLGELLKGAGFVTAFFDLPLAGREFGNEDALYHEIVTAVRAAPDVKREDYVAVALNRFTPARAAAPRFSAQVTYRILRVGDGEILLPDKLVAGDSGEQSTDDMARTVAVELAVRKAAAVLPGEVSRALRQLERSGARESEAARVSYPIRVDNVSSPAATSALKQALRSAGFGVSSQFRGEARSEALTVTLNGRTGADVTSVLEPLLGSFDVVLMDERSTVLKAR